MPSLLIRNVPDSQISALDEMAQKSRKSREELLRGEIGKMVAGWDPEIILGFAQLRGGDHLGDSSCDCGREFSEAGVFIGFTADLQPFGPVCGFCAEVEEGLISVQEHFEQ